MIGTFRRICEQKPPWRVTNRELAALYAGPVAGILLAIMFMCGPNHQWEPLTCFCAAYTEMVVLYMMIKRVHCGMHPLVDKANKFDLMTIAFVWVIWFCVYREFHSF